MLYYCMLVNESGQIRNRLDENESGNEVANLKDVVVDLFDREGLSSRTLKLPASFHQFAMTSIRKPLDQFDDGMEQPCHR